MTQSKATQKKEQEKQMKSKILYSRFYTFLAEHNEHPRRWYVCDNNKKSLCVMMLHNKHKTLESNILISFKLLILLFFLCLLHLRTRLSLEWKDFVRAFFIVNKRSIFRWYFDVRPSVLSFVIVCKYSRM